MRLQTKTLALFSVSGALILAVIGLIQFMVLKAQAFADIENQISRQLEHLDFALTRFVRDVENDLRVLAADARVRTPDDGEFTSFLRADEKTFAYRTGPREQEIIDLFRTFKQYHPHVNSVYMGRENGSFVRSHKRERPTQYDPRDRPWYSLAKDHPDAVMRTRPYRSVTSPDVNIGVVMPLADEKRGFFGVLGADITLTNLTDYLTDFALATTARSCCWTVRAWFWPTRTARRFSPTSVTFSPAESGCSRPPTAPMWSWRDPGDAATPTYTVRPGPVGYWRHCLTSAASRRTSARR